MNQVLHACKGIHFEHADLSSTRHACWKRRRRRRGPGLTWAGVRRRSMGGHARWLACGAPRECRVLAGKVTMPPAVPTTTGSQNCWWSKCTWSKVLQNAVSTMPGDCTFDERRQASKPRYHRPRLVAPPAPAIALARLPPAGPLLKSHPTRMPLPRAGRGPRSSYAEGNQGVDAAHSDRQTPQSRLLHPVWVFTLC